MTCAQLELMGVMVGLLAGRLRFGEGEVGPLMGLDLSNYSSLCNLIQIDTERC
jgi:hypothetical protein